MSRKRSRKIGECVYCGKIGEVTRDHIPPKGLFAKPYPKNLITVPSCGTCHSNNPKVSQDDEYFRLVVSYRDDLSTNPDILKIQKSVDRSFLYPNKIGLTTTFFNSFSDIEERTKSGLYLGKKSTYTVFSIRLENVADRIIKGLFWHEMKHRVPDDYYVISVTEDRVQAAPESVTIPLLENVLPHLAKSSVKTIGDHTFSYRSIYNPEDSNESMWLLTFYEKVQFLCTTVPKSKILPLTI